MGGESVPEYEAVHHIRAGGMSGDPRISQGTLNRPAVVLCTLKQAFTSAEVT